MTKPKRHHFVPQFYLRRFSTDRRSIVCYNKAKRLLIPSASIKGQCAIDNYYGWDDRIEQSLGVIEGYVASLLNKISHENELPHQNSEEWQILLIFIAIQSSRTKMSGDSNNVMTDYFAKTMAQGAPELAGINLGNIKVHTTFPAAMPMQVSIQAYSHLGSLGRCLLLNESSSPFLCSDNPIILYNSQRARWRDRGVIGLDSAGIQILFPISPTHAIYLYDADNYSSPSNTGLRKIGKDDAVRVNLLNYLWSDENVYLASAKQGPVIETIGEVADQYINYERVSIRESEPVDKDNENTSSLIMQFRPHAPIEMAFSFARYEPELDQAHTGLRSRTSRRPDNRPPKAIYQFRLEKERPQLCGNELARGIRKILKSLG